MGKDNKAQRTKNNARPSNSGRSAELLGNAASSFVGFSSVKDGGYIPVLPTVNIDDMDSSIDPNFQLLLKKMTKKDSTTKLKALQEFSELVQKSDVESLKAVLPFWPRLYSLLSLDLDHRVREGLHLAQHAVVLKAKRNIAPYLKQLVGPWFTSQYDSYPPAASAAALAFTAAFPPAKLLEAIAFCQHEILAYVYEQLIEQTQQALGSNTSMSPEELEAKQQRILVSSLQGYALYLQKMPPDQIRAALDDNNKIVQAKKFWKLAKHPSALVRQGWYTCVIALCQKSPDLVTSQASVVVLAVLANLDEQDPTVLPAVWDAALHVITVVPDCWSHVNVDKLVLPKLWSLLRNAGHGNAGAILPGLLPFVSQLPPALTADNKTAFYDKFFDNLRTGFCSKMSVQSPAECNALAKCYVECIRYSIMKNQADLDFCQHTIHTQLVSALGLVTTDARLNLLSEPLFSQTSQLLHHWDRTGSSLLPLFWAAIGRLQLDLLAPIGADSMEAATKPADWLLARQVDFCLSVKCPTPKKSTNQRVRFTTQTSDDPADQTTPALPSSSSGSSSFTSSLQDLATSLCRSYFTSAKGDGTAHFLTPLSRLVDAFVSRPLLEALATPLAALYTDTLRHWLRDGPMSTQEAWHITFLLVRHLDDQDRQAVFDDLAQLCVCGGAVACLTAALGHREEPSVRRFLLSAPVTQELTALTAALASNKALTAHKEVLTLFCTTQDGDGGMVMSGEALTSVVDILSTNMRSPTCESLALTLSSVLFSQPPTSQSTTLLVALFAATLTRPNEAVGAAVGAGAEAMVRGGRREQLIAAVADRVATQLDKCAASLDCVVDACWHLLSSCCTDDSRSVDTVSMLLRLVQPAQPERWDQALNAICESCTVLVVNKHAGSTTSPTTDSSPLIEWLERWVLLSAFTAGLLSKLFDPPVDVRLDAVEEHVSRVVAAVAVCQSIASRFASTVYNYRLASRYSVLLKQFTALLSLAGQKDAQLFLGEMVRHRHLILSAMDQSAASVYGCVREDVDLAAANITSLFKDKQDGGSEKQDGGTLLSERPEQLLYDCDVSREPRDSVERVASFARRYSVVLDASDHGAKQLLVEDKALDFVFISLASWFLSVKKSRHKLLAVSTNRVLPLVLSTNRLPPLVLSTNDSTDVMETHNAAVFTINVCKMLCGLYRFLGNENEATKELREEWKAVFQQEVADILVETFIMIADQSTEPAGLSLLDVPVVEHLGRALQLVGPASYAKRDKLVNTCLGALSSPVIAVQMTAYHILADMVASLVSADRQTQAQLDDPATGRYDLRLLLPLLADTDTAVSDTLEGVRLGDSCAVTPHTAAASCTAAYLMLWTLVLDMCAEADSQLRCQYATMLRELGLLGNMLKNVFRLMPDQVLDVSDVKSRTPRLSELFSTAPSLAHGQPWTTPQLLEHTACWVYWLSLCHLPAEVRTWWSGSEQRCSGLVERITTRYVSPTLCDQEMKQVQLRMQSQAAKYDNMKIKVFASVREVSAVYTVDEARMELVMALPPNYPLGLVKIDSPRNVAGTNQGRTWLMQLTMFLTSQNGSLWNGLNLWKSNLDKRFEGIAECCICYSVLSGTNFQLPKVCCRTCKKKFHSGCLYKWFSTSNKSTCPICRNLF